jgi:hypothetical protein
MKNINTTFFLILLVAVASVSADAQIQTGSRTARRVGVHRGNQVRTAFTNYGVIGQPGSQGPNTAWKYDANGYATDIAPIIGVRLPIRDYPVNGYKDGYPDTLYSTIVCNADRSGTGDFSPDGGTFWGFEPIPGFANPNAAGIGKGIAMEHLPDTWPAHWPDHPDWVDAKGKPEWNGYFGRGQKNADQESYFMMDDNADQKFYQRYQFLPDSTDPSRKGQAIRVSVRGLQWSNFLAQDVIFWLYEITNVGTTTYDQAVFGTLVGTYVGVGPSGGDEWDDDATFFNVRENITYTWDFDHYIRPSANSQWKPNPSAVGYIGYAFLESPGNKYDGIDNDGDNRTTGGTAKYFTESDFQPHTVKAGDKLVLIDKATFARSTFIMPASPTDVTSMGVKFHLVPDTTVLVEGNLTTGPSGLTVNANAYDGIDNDLDGLIDENYQLHYRQYKATTKGVVMIDTLNPVQHKDYASGTGLTDAMIDEGRDDGIDNNRNWNPLTDDVGLDGKAGTGDFGEGDGKPTSGFQPLGPHGELVDTGLPGEPNTDKTDVEESDQLGLTSFQYFVPSTAIDLSNEKDIWQRLQPGHFDVPASVVNNRTTRGEDGDFIFGSGYFPLLPKKTERFSLALVFGDDLPGVIRTKNIAQLIYNANYNFPRPPEKPTLAAVAGDHKVTLYWDKAAESSYDMALKQYDFEGYKIYKGTDPDFSDAKTISNGYGQLVDYQPIAQFDLKDGVQGLFKSDALLYELSSGKPFYLGSETGITNSFVDEDVVNGKTYYYAVVAYDKGSSERSIYPSENTKAISIDAAGMTVLDKNTVMVVPNAPASGYTPPASGVALTRVSGISSTVPYVNVVDAPRVKNASYYLTFTDSLVQGVPVGYAYTLTDSATHETITKKDTHFYATNGNVFDGLTLSFDSRFQSLDSVRVDTAHSGWNRSASNALRYSVTQFNAIGVKGVRYPYDYMFVFSDAFRDSATSLPAIFGGGSPLEAKRTNFSVYEITGGMAPRKVEYGYVDKDGARQDTLSDFDAVYLSSRDGKNLSWRVTFIGEDAKAPQPGDTLFIRFMKPLCAADTFIYRAKAAQYDLSAARLGMNDIRAVPNPYVETNVFEQPLPPQVRGRGERVIAFIHLPPDATITIYTANGSLVRTLHHGGNLENGSEEWDLRSSEGLDVAFGVYFYVVDARGIAEKKYGKLAIIK